MTPEMLIALAQVLVPVVQAGAVEVAKLIATLNSNITAEQLAQVLEESKSADWPKLTFGVED
jgi:hypothetical protein